MADQDTSLPVRSEADADERLQSKIVDFTTPTQGQEVDTDGNAHVEMHGNDAGGTDRVMRLSEEGAPNPDGDYDASNNSEPASSAVMAHDENASPTEVHQNKRVTASQTGTKTGLHVALLDEDSVPYSGSNPMPVTFEASEGTEIIDYDTAAAIAKDATDNHDYTVSGAVTLTLEEIWATASGKMKIEVQFETAAASGVFNTKWVAFNSTSHPNIRIPIEKIGQQVTGAIVRIIRTNLDNQAQDLYSTILGVEA